MRRGSTIRKVIALLAIVPVFAGTQGFVISSHTCNSCGTHEEIISLFGSNAGSSHDCSTGGSQSCCPEAEAPGNKNNSCCHEAEAPGNNDNSCCTEAEAPGNNDNSCCTSPEPAEKGTSQGNASLTVAVTHGSCCSTESTSCETIDGGVCCEFETERIAVEPYKQEKQENILITSPTAPVSLITLPEPVTPTATVTAEPCNKHGGAETIRFICCYLL